jgi:uracil-DNA glycosylase
MGVGTNQTGTFPGAKDPRFVEDCIAFLADTIRLLEPRALVVMGRETWKYVARLAPQLRGLANVSGFTQLDKLGLGVVHHVEVPGARRFGVATIVHPSYAHANWRWRRYGSLHGLEAEAELLRQAAAPHRFSN